MSTSGSENGQRVVVTVSEERVAHVRLHRADKRNGIDGPMFEALVSAGERISADRSIRAVVLSGEGKAFCAGLDWQWFLSMGTETTSKLLARDPEKSPANLAQRVCWIWSEVPVPVVAAVHGPALGGGFQLALACDFRIAARDVTMGALEIKYGLIPDMSISQTLLKLVRPDVARELIYTGRTVGADEALQLGLVTRVSDDALGDAMALARMIAAQSPSAIRAAKELTKRAPSMGTAEALAFETALQLPLLGSPNQVEAVSAVMGKRAAKFED